MPQLHDELAGKCCLEILENLSATGTQTFKQIFSNDLRRVGTSGWPRADFQLYDYNLNQSWAFEFKPPGQVKREYVTGLGQAVTYLNFADYAGLIIPKSSKDNFNISSYIQQTLSLSGLQNLPISIFEYDDKKILSSNQNFLNLIKPINLKRGGTPPMQQQSSSSQTFWAYFRDISQYEIFDILNLCDINRQKSSDIWTNSVWPVFKNKLVNKQCLTWEGQPRKIKSITGSEKQNTKIPFFRLGLFEQDSGELTLEGYDLLKIGKVFGPSSDTFLDALAKIVLINGSYLEFISEIERYQNNLQKGAPELQTSKQFCISFEDWLDGQGLIPKRKPGRTTTGNKNCFIRDELKLLSKLKLFHKKKTLLYHKGIGYKFNVSRLCSLMANN